MVDLLGYLVLVCIIDFICNDLKVVMVQIDWIGVRRAIVNIIDSIVIAAVVR